MKLVYTAPNPLWVQNVRNVLQHAGIACELRNEFLGGGAGDIPLNDIWPEIWVVHDEDVARAEELVTSCIKEDQPYQKSWVCKNCGTLIEGQFAACWNCGQSDEEETG